MKDPYQILRLNPDATDADVKRAYRRLAKELHPDLNPGDGIVEQQFKDVTQAYALLSDRKKRAAYDSGRVTADGAPRPGFGFWRGRRKGGLGDGVADDILAEMFGDARGRGHGIKMPGKDVTYRISIPFLDAVRGCKRRITQFDGGGLEIGVPAGTDDGQSLRLKGKGTQGMGGGAPGDAFVEITVEPHRFFERDGADIFLDVPVTLAEAIIGARITVPTIDGEVTLAVPPGSNSGTTLRLKGKGVRMARKPAGDEYVRLKVMLPDKPDEELIRFVRRWSQEYDYDVRRRAGLDKI